jgi:CBS domain containing-hemolysin-like protein
MSLLIILTVALFLSAFFAGLESAYITADKIRLEFEIQSGAFYSVPLRILFKNPGRFYTTLLIGYYLALITFSVTMVLFLASFPGAVSIHGWLIVIIDIVVVALFFVLLGDFIPRIIFRIYPDSFLIFLSFPFVFFYLLFYPLTWLIKSVIQIVIVISGNEDLKKNERRLYTMTSLGHFMKKEVRNPSLPEDKVEKEVILFRNALDFSKVRLHEIMVPRNEISVLDVNSDIETFRKKLVETGYSRILFYEGNIDNIVGYVHSSAIFQKAKSIRPFLKNVLVVPETMAANRLLSRFIREHRSIALVVDEFGGTAGLVTSEDILEEIFGEIEDEYDKTDFYGKKINEKQYVLSGRFKVDALNEKYDLKIPESENYETLAGFILFHHDTIPKINTSIRIGDFVFRIVKSTLTRIELVYLTILKD